MSIFRRREGSAGVSYSLLIGCVSCFLMVTFQKAGQTIAPLFSTVETALADMRSARLDDRPVSEVPPASEGNVPVLIDDCADGQLDQTVVDRLNAWTVATADKTGQEWCQTTHLYEVNVGLTEIVPEIGALTNLTFLSIGDNALTGVPTTIGNLKKLQTLQLFRDHLTSLPAEIGALPSLQYVYLNGNAFRSVPDEIGNWSQAVMVNLADNPLEHLPETVGQMQNLTTLYVSRSSLLDVPSSLVNLHNLSTLYLDSNLFVSLPADICTFLDTVADVIVDAGVCTEESF